MAAPSRQLNIFISYRREDSSHAAGRLFDRLKQHFAAGSVFMDVDAIDLGVDFHSKIESSIASCDIVIALIGRKWIDAAQASGRRRLEDPNDMVRLEIAAALRRDIHVIPVLVDGATMPPENKLPADLRPMLKRNGLEIGHAKFNSDVSHLIQGIEGISLPSKKQEATPEELRARRAEIAAARTPEQRPAAATEISKRLSQEEAAAPAPSPAAASEPAAKGSKLGEAVGDGILALLGLGLAYLAGVVGRFFTSDKSVAGYALLVLSILFIRGAFRYVRTRNFPGFVTVCAIVVVYVRMAFNILE